MYPQYGDILSLADLIILPASSSDDEQKIKISQLTFENLDTLRPQEEVSFKVDVQIDDQDQSLGNLNLVIESNEEATLKTKPFLCSQCPMTFSNRSDLRKHMVKHSDDYFECKFCEKRIKHKKNFLRHISLHDNKKILFECKFCDRSFSRKADYHRHLKHVHSLIIPK